ncbi:MAG: YeeE/YedE family protein, partial [Gammaproteobacteria bacterium]|nr:YeeE/YedE family protein [Gammaproteobacteria bacterium]
MPIIIAFIAALLMSAGIAYSQMIDPEKVLGFLTLDASWDPSLILVMAAGLAVYSTGYWLFGKKDKPLFAEHFSLPGKKDLDKPLVIGSLL